ncbi:hypothetical protein H2200_003964 [Cladophialophora chaetospira]|uniref:Uncharacterized protein n=1 Tax=Cladophialophora chaetospira TaxID=386627 RepID=A0AA39CL86_9EURO|nr:hypothetical protein H2200_003964 [Cladophialophora chaetospira]
MEASRRLFSTVSLGPNVESNERASEIMADPDYAKYIRSVEFRGYGRTRYLRRMMAKLESRNVTTVSLSALNLNEAVCLFSDENERAGLFACVSQLTLDFRCFGGVDYPSFTVLWNEGLSRGCSNLSGQLPLLQTLQIGFHALPGYDLPLLLCLARKDITKSLLSQNFARLASLTLRNVIATEDDLADFINRHHKTLKSLTLRGMHFECAQVVTWDKFGRRLPGVSEFIRSLNSKIRFKGLRIDGMITASEVAGLSL